jgi:SAM-dependent methyltransferase
MKTNDWIKKLYEFQSQHEAEYKLPTAYWMPEGVDAWLHRRKLIQVLPLIQNSPDSKWLTIGDGRFGSDAYFLNKMGVHAVASSISDATLKVALERGYIQEYKVENAERMTSSDGEFDYVLCKESYHHFPRPPLAFYEMLRVASKAVILIEPIEGPNRLLDWLRNSVVKKLVRGDQSALFEPSGNFIYRVSIREIEKMMNAINGSIIAVRFFNTFYHPKLASQINGFTIGSLLTKLAISIQDLLCHLRLMNYGLATIIAFKTPATPEIQQALRDSGYHLIYLPQNPYLSD